MRLAIDPGHNCRPDIGAEFESDCKVLREDEIALAVALELKRIAQTNKHTVIWCLPDRAESVSDSLRQRAEKANCNDADIYISIHCNVADPTDAPRGSEVYAISEGGKLLGNRILEALTGLGWKSRGVKSSLDGGSPPYVIRATLATAVLVELCFLDSAADREILAKTSPTHIAEAIYSAIKVKAGRLSVGEAIVKWPGSTDAAKGLSDSVIQAVGLGNLELVKASNFGGESTCDPYFQPAAAKSLRRILSENQSLPLKCSSAYRSPVRQAILWECGQRRIGGITLAAMPGTSDHERGLALDIANYMVWMPIMIKAGWKWQGLQDTVHFYFPDGDRELPRKSISAFQTLHNRYGSGEELAVDGRWGGMTRAAMLAAPAQGWE